MSSSPGISGSTAGTSSSVALLLDHVSQEIGTYRNRQTRNFRETVIVQALISWGVMQLKLGPSGIAWIIRVAAAVACLAATAVGMWLINSDKKRIYFLRDIREELAKQLGGPLVCSPLFYPAGANVKPKGILSRLLYPAGANVKPKGIPSWLFYPADANVKPKWTVKKEYETKPTSFIYSITLLIVGLFAAIVNVLLGSGYLTYRQ